MALGLVGHADLNRTVGHNQGWNHAGNVAAALLAIGFAGAETHWARIPRSYGGVPPIALFCLGHANESTIRRSRRTSLMSNDFGSIVVS